MKPGDDLGAWLQSSADALRADARRALDELVARGDLSAEEARALEEGVAGALERSHAFVSTNVLAPLRAVLGSLGAPGARDAELSARLDALDERLARIERRLAGDDGPGEGGDDGPREGGRDAPGEGGDPPWS